MTFKIMWNNVTGIHSRRFVCSYCNSLIASERGFTGKRIGASSDVTDLIYICHHCSKPTYFTERGSQIPGVSFGQEVQDIDDAGVRDLYAEARNCTSAGAYTAATLCCRKLLMHIAVSKGAGENLNFIEYVNYLEQKGYFPPGGRDWVDHIRKKGNEANHDIVIMGRDTAEELLAFLEMLLKFIFEYPAQMKRKIQPVPDKS